MATPFFNVVTLISNNHKLNPLTISAMDWVLNNDETVDRELCNAGFKLFPLHRTGTG
jgi:hypothetical protein